MSRAEIRAALHQATSDLQAGWPLSDLVQPGLEIAVSLQEARRGGYLALQVTLKLEEREEILVLPEAKVLYLRPYVRIIEWARHRLGLFLSRGKVGP